CRFFAWRLCIGPTLTIIVELRRCRPRRPKDEANRNWRLIGPGRLERGTRRSGRHRVDALHVPPEERNLAMWIPRSHWCLIAGIVCLALLGAPGAAKAGLLQVTISQSGAAGSPVTVIDTDMDDVIVTNGSLGSFTYSIIVTSVHPGL